MESARLAHSAARSSRENSWCKEELTLEYRRREAERKKEKKKSSETSGETQRHRKAFENAEYPDPEKSGEAAQFRPGYER